ncbi:hypothetical protein V6Z12_D01G217300 [Gossypium hirsutum]
MSVPLFSLVICFIISERSSAFTSKGTYSFEASITACFLTLFCKPQMKNQNIKQPKGTKKAQYLFPFSNGANLRLISMWPSLSGFSGRNGWTDKTKVGIGYNFSGFFGFRRIQQSSQTLGLGFGFRINRFIDLLLMLPFRTFTHSFRE